MTTGMVMAVTTTFILGFLAGLLTFRVKCRWCPQCGATTVTLQARHDHTAAHPR